jgi:hypothetical protein
MKTDLTESEVAPDEVPQKRELAVSRRDILGGVAAAALLAGRRALGAARSQTQPQRIFRIHPAINVARAGNAPSDSFFVSPEVPGQGPVEVDGSTVAHYKVNGQVRPQAARFRVYEWADRGDGVLVPIQEVTLQTSGIKDIVWTAQLANRKAAFHQFNGPPGEEYDPVDQRTAVPSMPLRNASVTDRGSLQTDFGPRTLSARTYAGGGAPQTFDSSSVPSGYPATWPVDAKSGGPVVPYLGELRADSRGRLLVIGGKGFAGYSALTAPALATYANNDGWFDDVGDGPVTATVILQDGTSVGTDPSTGSGWVLGAPPKFSPTIYAAVTLYDLLLDMAVRKLPVPATNGLFAAGGPLARVASLKADYTPGAQAEFPTTLPFFQDDILPILDRAFQYRWVTGLVDQKHDSMNVMLAGNAGLLDPSSAGAKTRSGVFIYLRPPQGAGVVPNGAPGASSMPHLQGDNPYVGTSAAPDPVRKQTLTHLQYGFLQQWAQPQNGFDPGAAPGPSDAPSQLAFFVHGLDRAALEQGSGAAFFPGIEVSWQIRNWRLFSEPFRINLLAKSRYLGINGLPELTPITSGHFSRQMALPWHADFNDCRSEGNWGWWPSQRPTDVFADTSTQQLSARVDWARASQGLHYSSQGPTSHADMLRYWASYGFVVKQGDMWAEQERNSGIGT